MVGLLMMGFALADDPPVDTGEPPPPPSASVVRKEPDSSDAPSDEPAGTETPCEWLMRHRNHDTSLPRIIELAETHRDLFTGKDIRCVRQAGFHKRVLQAIKNPTEAEVAAKQAEKAGESAADRFDVRFVGAVLGPAKLSGEAWDSEAEAQLTGDDLAAMSTMAPPGPVRVLAEDDVTDLLTRAEARLAEAADAPEVFGHVEYRGASVPMHWLGGQLILRKDGEAAHDSLYATFPEAPGFDGIRLRDTDLLMVSLSDADPADEPDPARTIEIRRADLEAIAQAGGTAGLLVADRTGNEVLVLVLRASPSTLANASSEGTFFRP